MEVPSTTTANEADSSAAETDTSVGGGEFSVAQVAENAMPSVVSITNAACRPCRISSAACRNIPFRVPDPELSWDRMTMNF